MYYSPKSNHCNLDKSPTSVGMAPIKSLNPNYKSTIVDEVGLKDNKISALPSTHIYWFQSPLSSSLAMRTNYLSMNSQPSSSIQHVHISSENLQQNSSHAGNLIDTTRISDSSTASIVPSISNQHSIPVSNHLVTPPRNLQSSQTSAPLHVFPHVSNASSTQYNSTLYPWDRRNSYVQNNCSPFSPPHPIQHIQQIFILMKKI